MMVSLSDKLLLATATLDVYLGLNTLEQCVNKQSKVNLQDWITG